MAHRNTYDLPALLADPCGLDRLIEWKMGSIQQLKRTRLAAITEGAHMQRQFTIELRVDYADNDKNGEMRKTLQRAARHAYATAQLLCDGVKPQIAIFSDDFFSGKEEIMLLEDEIAQGRAEIDGGDGDNDTTVSSELMAAVTGNGGI